MRSITPSRNTITIAPSHISVSKSKKYRLSAYLLPILSDHLTQFHTSSGTILRAHADWRHFRSSVIPVAVHLLDEWEDGRADVGTSGHEGLAEVQSAWVGTVEEGVEDGGSAA